MHIPDGFLSPKTYIPAYLIASGLWFYGIKRMRNELEDKAVPFLSVMAAFSFVISLVMVPIPGGSSGHAVGIGLLSVIFGYWTAFIVLSVVFFLQAVMFGDGGITTFPVNAVIMGFIGSITAYYIYRLLKNFNNTVALFFAGYTGLLVSAFLTAVVLGIQPYIAHDNNGNPLFFPFDLSITIPAVIIPHLFIGIGEGILTVAGWNIYRRLYDGEN
ncbi:MAG: energy-coupling factor ABC transporter permease [Persephonella sp.]|nr:energy-coupling factor ABC transporter permease [Persephonella sp.]